VEPLLLSLFYPGGRRDKSKSFAKIPPGCFAVV
jgi:hypothetical protein